MARRRVGDTYGSGQEALAEWANRLRSFAGNAGTTLAQRMVGPIQGQLAEAAAGNRSVSGEGWRPTKAGTKPLAGIMAAVSVRAIANQVIIMLTGHHVFHEFGTHRTPKRSLLPHGGMPDRIGNLIRLGYLEMAEEWLTRKGRHDTKASSAGMGKAVKGVNAKGGGNKGAKR
jgi:hypothetical protein